jgi:hypothetical protein
MKAIISSTYDNRYLYFIPICVWAWNKLGVDVICFMPFLKDGIYGYDPDKEKREKYSLIIDTLDGLGIELQAAPFLAPEHKEATYAQCSRLYAACLDLPEDEVLITGDVDMAVFSGINWFINPIIEGIPKEVVDYSLGIYGCDLVPENQYPMCYARSSVKGWRNKMNINGRVYQKCLDDLLGEIECESFRGNYWGKDQEGLYLSNRSHPTIEVTRARPNTQFANHRVDRDDENWRAYVNDDLIDAHLWRDGYTDQNHANIMELMRMKFPNEDFTWLENYRTEYLKLL